MNEDLKTIILGLITNALSSIISASGKRTYGLFLGAEESGKGQLSLNAILKNALDKISEEIVWTGTARFEEVCLFLTSPEAEGIVRQLFAAKLLEKDSKSIDLIKEELFKSFVLFTGNANEKKEALNALYNILASGCEDALNSAIDKGLLPAHEAKSSMRFQILRDEIESIKKNISLLNHSQINIAEILHFEEKYREQVKNRHSFIIPPHFDMAQKVPIDDLYVSPKMMSIPRSSKEQSITLSTENFRLGIYRTVLLGNPGGGKSTFSLKLCHDLSKNYKNRIVGKRHLTPVLIVLRDYGAEKKARNCSILQFIESKSNSLYQIKPPDGAFEYLFLNGRVIVVFDGLDELLETNYRQEISSDIESFCNLYPSVPVLITSREVGYEQAPLDTKKFVTFRLAPFEEEQVADYVQKWFNTINDLTSAQKRQKAQTFIQESRIVRDLRSHPLMLALMCNIYRGENYIPKNRPDVYKKCTLMLFDRWDKSRGIHITLPFEEHIKPAMMYLAHWIYDDEKLQGGVTEDKLISKTAEYLLERRFEDPDEARNAAKKFVEFCSGRAWVFTDVGTTKEGEKLYQFTHRTFLEYFTAAHIVRMHHTSEDLFNFFKNRIAYREWDVVAQLSFQLLNNEVESAGDRLLSLLVEQEPKFTAEQSWNLLSFGARALEFMVPSPKIIRELVKVCIDKGITEYIPKLEKYIPKLEKSKRASAPYYKAMKIQPGEVIGALLNCADENRATIENSLEKIISEKLKYGSENEIILALDIGLHLDFYFSNFNRIYITSEGDNHWRSVTDRFYNLFEDRIKLLLPKFPHLCRIAYNKDKISLQDAVNYHGLSFLFNSHNISFFTRGRFFSIVDTLVRFALLGYGKRNPSKHLDDMRQVGRILLSIPTPWPGKVMLFPERAIYNRTARTSYIVVKDSVDKNIIKSDPDLLFGVFILLAMDFEKSESFPKDIVETKNPFLNLLSGLLSARFKHLKEDEINKFFNELPFLEMQKTLIKQWVSKEINFTSDKMKIVEIEED